MIHIIVWVLFFSVPDLFPFILNVFLPLKIVYLRILVKDFVGWRDKYFIRVGIFTHIESNKSPYIEVNTRFCGMIMKLVRSGFTNFEKQEVSTIYNL